VNIKKRFTTSILTFTILLSLGQAVSVQAQATTIDLNIKSDNTVVNSIPNPGVPEVKPDPLKVISKYDTLSINNTDNINITSNIGWRKENGYWYYYKSDYTRATGWKQIDNIRYFFNDSGAMITGINVIDNKTYMFSDSGAMVSGWLQINNYRYYFNPSGSMVSGWVLDKEDRYYLYDNGAMAKGWINLNGTWYYLKPSGIMATGWVSVGSDYYYLDLATGSLITNTTIDGFKIGADGKRIVAQSIFKGIDISNHNGEIDFKKVKAAGIQLVYMKATEGTTYIDEYLGINYKGSKSAGLKTGFYHYLVGTSSPETQAQNFYNNIKDKQSDLKPVLDLETNGFDVMDYSIRFINEFKRLSNMDICIYTYSGFIINLDSRLAKCTLWEANYHTTFSDLPANNTWTSRAGFQYIAQGTIDGINGNVDLDQFTQDIFR